jgi:hypothetical protein
VAQSRGHLRHLVPTIDSQTDKNRLLPLPLLLLALHSACRLIPTAVPAGHLTFRLKRKTVHSSIENCADDQDKGSENFCKLIAVPDSFDTTQMSYNVSGFQPLVTISLLCAAWGRRN